MSRTHRLFDLLQTLRRHRQPVTGAALAREAGVSLRTLYRDIAVLQTMGAEIEGEPGLGYVLKPGFLLPPLMFSAAEIEALALGAQWVARRTDEGMSRAAQNAMAKIAAVLPGEMREKLEDDALIIGQGWERSQTVGLSVLRQALHDERKLAITYCDEKGARTARVIWPTALGFFETTRVLVAWCELRQGFRHFRADRIEAAERLPDRPPRRRKALVKEWRKTLLTESDSSGAYKTCSHIREENPKENSMSRELILYTNPRSRGAMAHWMLEEIGCPYKIEVMEYGTTIKSPDYLAINPMGKVPAIKHGDTVVTESAAILAYLADAFPEAGLAPAIGERGEYYRWLFFAAGCVEPAMSNHAAGWDPSTPELQGRFGYGSFAQVMDTVSIAVKGKTYIAGDRFTAADLYMGAILNWGMMFGIIDKRPEFEAYCSGLMQRPAGARAREQAEKLTNQHAWTAA
jgi:predicted DNA-binding transcriptional regulator YafY/glutathione S-transferase